MDYRWNEFNMFFSTFTASNFGSSQFFICGNYELRFCQVSGIYNIPLCRYKRGYNRELCNVKHHIVLYPRASRIPLNGRKQNFTSIGDFQNVFMFYMFYWALPFLCHIVKLYTVRLESLFLYLIILLCFEPITVNLWYFKSTILIHFMWFLPCIFTNSRPLSPYKLNANAKSNIFCLDSIEGDVLKNICRHNNE